MASFMRAFAQEFNQHPANVGCRALAPDTLRPDTSPSHPPVRRGFVANGLWLWDGEIACVDQAQVLREVPRGLGAARCVPLTIVPCVMDPARRGLLSRSSSRPATKNSASRALTPSLSAVSSGSAGSGGNSAVAVPLVLGTYHAQLGEPHAWLQLEARSGPGGRGRGLAQAQAPLFVVRTMESGPFSDTLVAMKMARIS